MCRFQMQKLNASMSDMDSRRQGTKKITTRKLSPETLGFLNGNVGLDSFFLFFLVPNSYARVIMEFLSVINMYKNMAPSNLGLQPVGRRQNKIMKY